MFPKSVTKYLLMAVVAAIVASGCSGEKPATPPPAASKSTENPGSIAPTRGAAGNRAVQPGMAGVPK